MIKGDRSYPVCFLRTSTPGDCSGPHIQIRTPDEPRCLSLPMSGLYSLSDGFCMCDCYPQSHSLMKCRSGPLRRPLEVKDATGRRFQCGICDFLRRGNQGTSAQLHCTMRFSAMFWGSTKALTGSQRGRLLDLPAFHFSYNRKQTGLRSQVRNGQLNLGNLQNPERW